MENIQNVKTAPRFESVKEIDQAKIPAQFRRIYTKMIMPLTTANKYKIRIDPKMQQNAHAGNVYGVYGAQRTTNE